MRREVSVSLKQVVALLAVCGVARSSVYFSRKAVASPVTMSTPKRGPVGAFTDAQLVEQIRAVLADTPFLGEGYRKVSPPVLPHVILLPSAS